MLTSLTLKNFRKHRNIDLNFTDGLNVVKGRNELGKTTLIEGILYTWFGSEALRESLAQVVTEGEPESSLRAISRFTFDGVCYTASRGASGAEITYGDQRVTGQTETKRFMERLLKASFKTTKHLMFATQGSIQGVLSEGSAANSLVETLADLAVIETIVTDVQEHLPTGSLTSIDQQIEVAKKAVEQTPETPDTSERDRLTAEKTEAQAKSDLAETRRPADQEVAYTLATLEAHRASTALLSRLTSQADQIRATLAQPVAVPAFTLADLQQKRVEAASIPEQERRAKARATKFPTCVHTFEGGKALLQKEFEAVVDACDRLENQVTLAKQVVRDKTLKKINEKNCAFCKKDLTDVPEVAQWNAALGAEVVAEQTRLDILQKEWEHKKTQLQAYREVKATTEKVEQLMGEYWKAADGDTLPPVPVWIGAEPEETGELRQNLLRMEGLWQGYQQALTARTAKEQQLAEVQKEIDEVLGKLNGFDKAAHETLLTVMQLSVQHADAAKVELQAAHIRWEAAQRAYEVALNVHTQALDRISKAKEQITSLEATRAQMLEHNELIKKLRAARPKIAAEMWSMVLGAISRYFTQIRGTPSVVTRDANGFKVNGRSPDGLSGSTRDALGLAIRMALSKLFLPNVTLIVLDESFSGADSQREVQSITTLASAGFTQALLITHSSEADSLASCLIELS